jgi:hypothetical protein
MAASLLRMGICPLKKTCFSGCSLAHPMKIIMATYAKAPKGKGKGNLEWVCSLNGQEYGIINWPYAGCTKYTTVYSTI